MNVELRNILWVNFKNGKSDSLSLLYKEYADELYSYGMKVYGNDSLVKDCIHEVFIQLIDKRESLKITSQIHTYLFKSLRNKLLEELRSKNRKQDIISQLSEFETPYEKYAEQKIIEDEENKSLRKKIQTSVEKLSNRQREIIYLKYTKDFSYDEIAEILQIDKASARTLLYRTLKTLKDQLCSNALILMVLIDSFFKKERS
jgi:RNA polymerase sigma factor (sigma-70 family)